MVTGAISFFTVRLMFCRASANFLAQKSGGTGLPRKMVLACLKSGPLFRRGGGEWWGMGQSATVRSMHKLNKTWPNTHPPRVVFFSVFWVFGQRGRQNSQKFLGTRLYRIISIRGEYGNVSFN